MGSFDNTRNRVMFFVKKMKKEEISSSKYELGPEIGICTSAAEIFPLRCFNSVKWEYLSKMESQNNHRQRHSLEGFQ